MILTLGTSKMADGTQTTLDVNVPAATPLGSTLRFLAYSSADDFHRYQTLPLFAIAGNACSTFSGCEECTSHVGCGFCATSGNCEIEGVSGSLDSSCSGASFATWTGSCSGFCAAHSGSCTDCASQPGCGWCASGPGPHCVEASRDFSHPEAGSCAYADWSFTPAYCPL